MMKDASQEVGWEWNKSYIVVDAVSMARRASNNDKSFTSSYNPQLLNELAEVMFDCPEKPSDFSFSVKSVPQLHSKICLTSGGADSTIAWYQSGKPQGLYIDIGQPYAEKERSALARLGIPHHYVDMRGTHLASRTWKHIIPGRNFLFLGVAAEMLKNQGEIIFSVVDGEGLNSGKGDKSYKFITLFEDWYRRVTGKYLRVITMGERTKAGWLKWFVDEGHDINIIRYDTVTCFSGDVYQCGECQACLRKFLSFMSLGMDISADFVAYPMFGAAEYVQKYQIKLKEALTNLDFSHYSQQRCIEDLQAIYDAQKLMVEGRSS